MMAYFSPGRVTLRQFVFVFVYIWVVFGLYLGDDGLLQSRKSDFATTPEKGKYVHQAKGAHHLSRKKHEQCADYVYYIL